MVRPCTRPSPSASPGSRRTSAPPRPRRPGRCCASRPPGSGKTTTLVARVAWLVDGGARPGVGLLVAFNKRAAEELTERLDAALAPLGRRGGLRAGADVPRARPRDPRATRGVPVEPARRPGRGAARAVPAASRGPTAVGWTSRSRGSSWTCGSRRTRSRRTRRRAGRAAFVAYEAAVAADGRRRLRRPPRPRARACSGRRACSRRWRARARAAARRRGAGPRPDPAGAGAAARRPRERRVPRRATTTRRSTAGGWPTCGACSGLAAVAARAAARGPRRPTTAVRRPVVARAVRLVEHNRERFAKRILAGSRAGGRLVLRARTRADDAVRVRAGDGALAGRRLDAGRPRADQPGAARGGGRRARARAPVPGAGPRAGARGRRARRRCSTGAAAGAATARRPLAGRSAGSAAELRAEAAADGDDAAGRPTSRRPPTS